MNVNLELNPYNAITILAFLRDFVNDDLADVYMFQAIREAVNEYESELAKKLTDDQWNEINMVNQINQLIGKSPQKLNRHK